MSTFIRASKFRHVFCENPRPDAIYSNLRTSTVTGEQNYIKANELYFATGVAGMYVERKIYDYDVLFHFTKLFVLNFHFFLLILLLLILLLLILLLLLLLLLSGGGGPFIVYPIAKPGQINVKTPTICGHSSAVLDFDFNPFHDHMVASCSEDCTIKVWGIPEGGVTENITEPLVDLHGHQRKVSLIKFHPTASNILVSTSGDQTVKLWDIEKGAVINTLSDAHDQLIQDIVWDYSGTTYTTSSKDKHVRICDARSGSVASIIENAHEGAKSTKLTYLGPHNKLVTVGFTRQSQRQFKIWDPRKTSEELKRVDVDQAAGVIMPFFDPDTNLLYLAGKGDGNVRFYEIVSDNPYCYPVADHRSQTPAKGMAWVPKRGLNIMGCETARLLKLTTNSVEPLCFFVPRKAEMFQDDLYPDTISSEAAHSADEWMAGSNKNPILMSLNPNAGAGGVRPKSMANPVAAPVSGIVASAPKTVPQLQAELAQANARIKLLEERLQKAGLGI